MINKNCKQKNNNEIFNEYTAHRQFQQLKFFGGKEITTELIEKNKCELGVCVSVINASISVNVRKRAYKNRAKTVKVRSLRTSTTHV